MGESRDAARDFGYKHGLSFIVLSDPSGAIYRNFRSSWSNSVPFNVVIDRNGMVQYAEAGFSPRELARVVNGLLAKKAAVRAR